MSHDDAPAERKLDQWLATEKATLNHALDDVLDPERGLADAKLPSLRHDLIRDLGQALDIDAGLDDILHAQPRPPVPTAELLRPQSEALGHDNPVEQNTEADGELDEGSRSTPGAEARPHEIGAKRALQPSGGATVLAGHEAGLLIATLTRDSELVRSAVTGNRAALVDVLRALRPLVFRYCLGRFGWRDGTADAEDCTQEVLLALVGALPAYRYEPENFLPFVFGIAAHKASEFHRRRVRDGRPEVEPPPVAEAWAGGLLDTLPPRQREILILRIILGLTAEETAAAVGLGSPGAVRIAQHRALTSLRRAIEAQKRASS
ncbi:sigma factor [Amycolatopsis sp. NPDC088138]|uniref:sigma factor n=1 Tax=Amycolatopsis sp. NPDC088138 TaxID=3363938 RepID=UPI003823F4CD